MSALLDNIVNVTITLESPPASGASYSNILLVSKVPESPSETMDDLTVITSPADLKKYGYKADDPVYVAASIVFSQSPCPKKVYVTARKVAEEPTLETLDVTLDRINTAEWYGFALCGYTEKADIEAAIKWAEAHEKLFCYTYHDADRPTSLQGYFRTYDVYADSTDDSGCDYVALALMAKCFGYEPGSETWALKNLAAVPTSVITADKVMEYQDKNSTCYVNVDGTSITQGGKTIGGEWIDVIRFRDYLTNEIKARVFAYLVANKKVPYTDAGITGIHGQVIAALKAGQQTGGIPDVEYDDAGNEIAPYTITVPRSYQIDKATKQTRKLPVIKFTARLAGAIHAAEVSGVLGY